MLGDPIQIVLIPGIYVQSYEFWWLTGWSSITVSFSSVIVTILPMWMLSGNTFVRWQSGAFLILTVFVLNSVIQIALPSLQYSGVALSSLAGVAISFFAQLVPMLLAPCVLRGQLHSSMRNPCRMHSVIVIIELFVAASVAGAVAPAFSRASPAVQVGIRLVIFPIFVEMLVMVSRCTGVRYLKPHMPQDVMLGYMMQAVTITAIVGRFLTTNMNTTAQTVLVSVATATVEVVMRLTMVHRDGFYQKLCGKSAMRSLQRCRARLLCQSPPAAPTPDDIDSGDDDDLGAGVSEAEAASFMQHPQAKHVVRFPGNPASVASTFSQTELLDDSARGSMELTEQSSLPGSVSGSVSATPSLVQPQLLLSTGGSTRELTLKNEKETTNGSRIDDDTTVVTSTTMDPHSSATGSSYASGTHSGSFAGSGTRSSGMHVGHFSAHSSNAQSSVSAPYGHSQASSGLDTAAGAALSLGPTEQSLLPSAAISIHVPEHHAKDYRVYQRAAHMYSTAAATPNSRARMRRVGNNAVNTQSYYAFLIADTMGEDIGILASLSLSLLFRVPARRGELPISPEQVVIRVLIQYLLELLTDIGPALTYYATSMLCGVRLSPVTSRMVAQSVGVPAAHVKASGAASRLAKMASLSSREPLTLQLVPIDTHLGPTEPRSAPPAGEVSSTPKGFQTPGLPALGAITELSEIDSDDDSVIGDMPSERDRTRSRLASQSGLSEFEDSGLNVSAQMQDMHGSYSTSLSARELSGVGVTDLPRESEQQQQALAFPTPGTTPASSDAGVRAPPSPGAVNTKAPARAAWCSCGGIMLREDDTDVVVASAHAHDVFALRRLAVASDPIWQPVRMRQLLHMAVFGSCMMDAEEAVMSAPPVSDSPPFLAPQGGAGTEVVDEVKHGTDASPPPAAGLAGGPAAGRMSMQHSMSTMSEASERDFVLAKPRRVLFREVRAASLQQLSTAQYAAVWLSLRTELLAVRLSRAWETRVPGWAFLYVFGALHALTLIGRVLAGVTLRCPYVDPEGEWYWNFCTAE